MTKAKTYKSDALAAIHETVSGMFESGVISKQTMRHFDESCLTPVHAFSAEEIKSLREREEVSQTVFAHYLNVTTTSVSQWELGRKTRWHNAKTSFSYRARRACCHCINLIFWGCKPFFASS